jgi:hypothetical protein
MGARVAAWSIAIVSNDEKDFEIRNAVPTVAANAAHAARAPRNAPETSASVATTGPAVRRVNIPADRIKPICCQLRAFDSKNFGQKGDDTPKAAYIVT